MNWEKICAICQAELQQFETKQRKLQNFLLPGESFADCFLRCEEQDTETVDVAVRQFAASGKWPPLSPAQELLLSFRLDFAASTAYLLWQQPAPWTEAGTELPARREEWLGWLMLFAWDTEGFDRVLGLLQKIAPNLSATK